MNTKETTSFLDFAKSCGVKGVAVVIPPSLDLGETLTRDENDRLDKLSGFLMSNPKLMTFGNQISKAKVQKAYKDCAKCTDVEAKEVVSMQNLLNVMKRWAYKVSVGEYKTKVIPFGAMDENNCELFVVGEMGHNGETVIPFNVKPSKEFNLEDEIKALCRKANGKGLLDKDIANVLSKVAKNGWAIEK